MLFIFHCVYLCINPTEIIILTYTPLNNPAIGPQILLAHFVFISEQKVRQWQIGFYKGDRYCLLRCTMWVLHWITQLSTHYHFGARQNTIFCLFTSKKKKKKRKGTACAEIYLVYEVNFPLFAFQILKVHTAVFLYGLERIFLSPAEDVSVLSNN